MAGSTIQRFREGGGQPLRCQRAAQSLRRVGKQWRVGDDETGARVCAAGSLQAPCGVERTKLHAVGN